MRPTLIGLPLPKVYSVEFFQVTDQMPLPEKNGI